MRKIALRRVKGSLDAPTRHPIEWRETDFFDEEQLDEELRRVFDICHGCRRCFNLCDSFPRLFDLVDESESGELDTVDSADFKPVVDACTLCDMCFMTKCPYVPPHEFNLDFPHLMLRYRAVEAKRDGVPWNENQLIQTDRNGRLAGKVSGSGELGLGSGQQDHPSGDRENSPVFIVMPTCRNSCRHPRPSLRRPKTGRLKSTPTPRRMAAKPCSTRPAFVNYNKPDTGVLAQRILAKNGVATTAMHPHCCGMPQLEQGLMEDVASYAKIVAKAFRPQVDAGKDIIALTPSCASDDEIRMAV